MRQNSARNRDQNCRLASSSPIIFLTWQVTLTRPATSNKNNDEHAVSGGDAALLMVMMRWVDLKCALGHRLSISKVGGIVAKRLVQKIRDRLDGHYC